METDGKTAYPEGAHKIREPNEPMKVKELVELVHMTVSSCHGHLKSLTLSTVMNAGLASQPVGYLSASQLSRECSGLFGSAPRDMAKLRQGTRPWVSPS